MKQRLKTRICPALVAVTLAGFPACAGDNPDDPAAWLDEEDSALVGDPTAAAVACARTVPVATSAALASAVAGAKPGDCIVAADGSYAGTTISARASAEKPVVVRAAHRGKAILTSKLRLLEASYVTVEGFDYTGHANVSIEDSDHCRITRSHFALDGGTFVTVTGTSDRNRIDHSDFGPLVNNGHLLNPTGFSTRTRIDHNYFHDVKPAGGNGRETISLGCCGATYDYHATGNVVENNLFVNCDGENEMIGLKSSNNTVRHNTIRRSRGFISLRAGRKNRVYGNYILGEGKAGTGGIRVFEDDHVIYNNYVDTEDMPLALTNGDPPGGGHAAIENVTVVNNTFITHGEAVKIGGTGHTVPPTGVFADNLLVGDSKCIYERNPNGLEFTGNIAFRKGGGTIGVDRPSHQFRVADPRLQSVAGALRPSGSGPVVNAATGSFSFLSDDVDSRAREGTADVGAFEASSSAAPRAPLTPADVGPDSH